MSTSLQEQLLLSYLLSGAGRDPKLCRSAREHMLCKALYGGIADLQRAEASLEEQLQLLGTLRAAAAQNESASSGSPALNSGCHIPC